MESKGVKMSQEEAKGGKRSHKETKRLDYIRLISLKITKGKPKGIKES